MNGKEGKENTSVRFPRQIPAAGPHRPRVFVKRPAARCLSSPLSLPPLGGRGGARSGPCAHRHGDERGQAGSGRRHSIPTAEGAPGGRWQPGLSQQSRPSALTPGSHPLAPLLGGSPWGAEGPGRRTSPVRDFCAFPEALTQRIAAPTAEPCRAAHTLRAAVPPAAGRARPGNKRGAPGAQRSAALPTAHPPSAGLPGRGAQPPQRRTEPNPGLTERRARTHRAAAAPAAPPSSPRAAHSAPRARAMPLPPPPPRPQPPPPPPGGASGGGAGGGNRAGPGEGGEHRPPPSLAERLPRTTCTPCPRGRRAPAAAAGKPPLPAASCRPNPLLLRPGSRQPQLEAVSGSRRGCPAAPPAPRSKGPTAAAV